MIKLPVFSTALLIAVCAMCLALPDKPPKSASDLLMQMRAKAGRIKDYEVTGKGETNGKRNEFKLYYKNPLLVRIDSRDGQVSVQPNGEVRGRLGKGAFGKISQKIGRNDKRLKDDEGIPFYDSYYGATVARIQKQIKSGAKTGMSVTPLGYVLTIRLRQLADAEHVRLQDQQEWRYTPDAKSLLFRESSRWVSGSRVEFTRYSDYRINSGLKTDLFKF